MQNHFTPGSEVLNGSVISDIITRKAILSSKNCSFMATQKKPAAFKGIHCFLIAGFMIAVSSCTTTKNVIYFENVQKDTTLKTLVSKDFEAKIRKNDVISIVVSSISPDVFVYNNSVASSTGSAGAAPAGYQQDEDGNILFPKLGIIHVEGLTRSELRSKLTKELSPYLKDPIVTVRFLNQHITVLGEVAKPQVLAMPAESMTLLDAIGASGDLTYTGRRDNILVIRDGNQGKEFHRLNLNNSSILASPYYYLKPDDVVYVEPTKVKLKNTTQSQAIIGYVLSGLSILVIILDRFIK